LILIPLLGLFVCVQVGRAQETDDRKVPLSVADPATATVAVARVGTITITAREFLLGYEFGPAFVKRAKDSRRLYIDYLVNEKLLALDGYERGVRRSARARETLDEIEGDLATEELYKEDVGSRVVVTQAEVEEGVRQEQTTVSLQWVFCASKEVADRMGQGLAGGASFDSLFARALGDSTKVDERRLETTRFKLGRSNPSFSRVIDTLRVRTPSSPVAGPDGWYIVRVSNVSLSALPTETEMFKLRSDVLRALHQGKSDSLSDAYVRGIMEKAAPVIQRPVFNRLAAYLGTRVLKKDTLERWGILKEFSDLEVSPESAIASSSGRKLVEMREGGFTLGEFLAWYRARETAIRLSTRSIQAYESSVEGMVWRMVRDRLLIRRARERHLQERGQVREQMKWWEEKIVYELVKESLADSIRPDDQTVRTYYDLHVSRYRDRNDAVLPFEKAKDDARKDLLEEEYTKRLYRRLAVLRKKHGVTVFDKTLASLRVDEGATAIDVYAVKKGGTLPRPAFPSIDYQWQAWR
jgi:hypothetical protein